MHSRRGWCSKVYDVVDFLANLMMEMKRVELFIEFPEMEFGFLRDV